MLFTVKIGKADAEHTYCHFTPKKNNKKHDTGKNDSIILK